MRYKLFGKSGLRVSELCLGAMTFGEDWGRGANKAGSQAVFDAFAEAGGNFIDTANRYTEGTSERYLGDFIQKDRDYFVVASKYSLYDDAQNPNAMGNHRKNMIRSVENSLKRLQTDFLDVLWVHAWDFTTPIEEVMRGLDDLVTRGKVHYIGISDTPAWLIARANTLAELKNWNSFVGLQIEYSLIQRTVERELIPMADFFEMAITPWSPLGAGILTGKYNQGMIEGGRLSEKSVKFNEKNLAIARVLSDVAHELQVPPSALAVAWLMRQGQNIIPIIGARNVKQLQESLHCLNLEADENHFQKLSQISSVEMGFPYDFLNSDGLRKNLYGDVFGEIDF